MTSKARLTGKDVEEIRPMLQLSAWYVSETRSENLDPEEIHQEVLINLMETPGFMDRFRKAHPDEQRAILLQCCSQAAARMQRSLKKFTGAVHYDYVEVRTVLRHLNDIPSGNRHPSVVAVRAGLRAMQDRHPTMYARLKSRFIDGESPDRKDTAAMNRIKRAVDKLVDVLNWDTDEQMSARYDGPGSRRALSNSATAALSSAQATGTN